MDASVVLVLILALLAQVYSDKPYKICSIGKDENDCYQLGRKLDVNCKTSYNGVNCILNIDQQKADFGRVTPEEAMVAANFVDNVVVLGEFRSDEIYDDAEYATAVLVKADYTGGLTGLRGKKYCHPGFKFVQDATELILKEFETAVLKGNNAEGCSNTVGSGTLLEKELKALSDFFGPSCRPGPWIDIEDLNTKYNNQYSKLCELCGFPNQQCTLEPGQVAFMQSIDCLVNRGGDVALTTLNTIYEFFNRTENVIKKNDYKYLCPNFTVSSLEYPCTWSKQPWNLIIANKNQAELIKNDLEVWLPKNVIKSGPTAYSLNAELEQYLEAVLFPIDKQYNKIYFKSQISLKDYIKEYRVIPNVRDSEKCKQDLKWCTVSDAEQQKCKWLAQASINHGIQPVINCVQSPNKLSCLEDIKNDKADVVTSDAHYGYIARRKNLAALAYPETVSDNRINTIVIIKDSNELGIQRFENLKTRKACIPEYGGTEWLSFINTAREHKVLSKTTCDYGELISEFVGESCMPGAHDSEHEKSAKTNGEKLCDLCIPAHAYHTKAAKTCNSDDTNKYYGNVGALTCLKEVGDFAVITKGDYPKINSSEFRVLCKNNSLASYTGFNVDSECVLSTIVDSEVVSKRNSPKNGDIKIALLNFEQRFGKDRVKAFEVFNVFNDTLDLLFKDSTPGLDSVNSENKYIKYYINLFAHVDKCSADEPGSATSARASLVVVFLTFILLINGRN